MDVERKETKNGKQHGPPADEQLTSVAKNQQQEEAGRGARDGDAPDEWSLQSEEEDERLFGGSPPSTGRATPFSLLLGHVLKNERGEIVRVAREIGVSDNTVYRWLNGMASPRSNHMQRLLEVLGQLPLASASSMQPVYQHNRGQSSQGGRLDVQRDLYRRVLEQAATTADDVSRRWHIVETIFEQALLLLDPDHHGMALTYARLMPPCADGTVHSLYEAEMRGQVPWPYTLEFKIYLGSTTLAGSAAMCQRVRLWSRSDTEARIPVGLDENEHSSCAAPVMRGGRVAGVLTVSSALDDFVNNPAVPRAIGEYANLLAAGLMDSDFYPRDIIRLVPMPDLRWQRERIAHSYVNRVVECARRRGLSYPEAEQKVLRELEEEFELCTSQQVNAAFHMENGFQEVEQPY